MATMKQRNMITYYLRELRSGKEGSMEDMENALRLFPDEFIGGVNRVYVEMSGTLGGLSIDEASIVISLFLDDKFSEGLNQLEHLIYE